MPLFLFSNLLNENAQLKYKEKELQEKLETQQKDYDTKHTVSNGTTAAVICEFEGFHLKIICKLFTVPFGGFSGQPFFIHVTWVLKTFRLLKHQL